MIDFSRPVEFHSLSGMSAEDLLKAIRMHCGSGRGMHQESLKSVVLKLTYMSRDMRVSQAERDEAATIGTSLANAAIQSYGRTSSFCMDLIAGVQMIVNSPAAA